MKKIWKSAAVLACASLMTLAGARSVKAELPAKPYVYNGHSYMLYYSKKNWEQAQKTCKAKGGHLVSITSKGENAFVYKMIKNRRKGGYWIGLTDRNREGDWSKWINGEKVKYQNWGETQPDNWRDDSTKNQNYAVMQNQTDGNEREGWIVNPGEWDDWSLDGTAQGYICEWDYTAETEKATIKLDKTSVSLYAGKSTALKATVKGKSKTVKWRSGDSSIASVSSTGKVTARKKGTVKITATANGVSATCTVTVKTHRYRRYDKSMTWKQAAAYCKKQGGHLVTITSPEEQRLVEKLMKNGTKKQYWLGARYSNNTWKWVTGEPFAYTNWNRGEPNNYRGVQEGFVEIYRTPNPRKHTSEVIGKWNDITNNNVVETERDFFDTKYVGFICEWD